MIGRLVTEVGVISELLQRLSQRVDNMEGGICDVAARVMNITGTLDAEKNKLLESVNRELDEYKVALQTVVNEARNEFKSTQNSVQ